VNPVTLIFILESPAQSLYVRISLAHHNGSGKSLEIWVNLIMPNRIFNNRFILSNNGVSICFSKGHVLVTFDRVLFTLSGFVSGIKLSVYPSPVIYLPTTKPLIPNPMLQAQNLLDNEQNSKAIVVHH
jgi:hypothetical protein